MNTTLQVLVDKKVRDRAQAFAEHLGFSSLQEMVRIFLNKIANKQIDLKFEEVIQLSPKNSKKYDKIIDEIESGRVKRKIFTNVDDLMKDLMK